MAKNAAITIRLPDVLKRRLQLRAKRERRSLSAQVLHDLESLASQEDSPPSGAGRFLGRFEGARVPTDDDLRAVRATLWTRLKPKKARRG